jgi:hypothetical protein
VFVFLIFVGKFMLTLLKAETAGQAGQKSLERIWSSHWTVEKKR